MGAYPAAGRIPAAPVPHPAGSRPGAPIHLRSGRWPASSYSRPNSHGIVIVPTVSGGTGAKRSGGTCGSPPPRRRANDVIGASCPRGRLFCSRHQSPLLHSKEPLCPAPPLTAQGTRARAPIRKKSQKDRILLNFRKSRTTEPHLCFPNPCCWS